MRPLVIFHVAIAVLLAALVEGQRFSHVCQPYSVFKVLCNTCWCSSDGINMVCTRKACPPSYRESFEPWSTYRQKERKMCEPGTYFKMDCNDCRCNEDGTNAACTLKACPRS